MSLNGSFVVDALVAVENTFGWVGVGRNWFVSFATAVLCFGERGFCRSPVAGAMRGGGEIGDVRVVLGLSSFCSVGPFFGSEGLGLGVGECFAVCGAVFSQDCCFRGLEISLVSTVFDGVGGVAVGCASGELVTKSS